MKTERVAGKLDFRRKFSLLVAGSITVAGVMAFGLGDAAQSQTEPQGTNADAKVPAFEVASIKPSKSSDGGMRIMFTPDGFSTTNIPLKIVISQAYGIREDLISGAPSWVDSARYDIEAKVAGPDVAELPKLSVDQRGSMLQSLLADRFELKAHRETKELPVYELVIAKNGPQLKEAKPGDTYANGIKGPDGVAHAGMMRIGPGQLTGQGIPMTTMVKLLSRQLHRTILDKTGLTGNYDITLQWAPEEGPSPMFPRPGGAQQETAPPSPDSSGPSIFTAIQEQLGLKLESTKGPVATLVVDHVETPSAN
ncbi:MAG TPA: TIGR03435 family protein [Acidobacteriaceae bacterium]